MRESVEGSTLFCWWLTDQAVVLCQRLTTPLCHLTTGCRGPLRHLLLQVLAPRTGALQKFLKTQKRENQNRPEQTTVKRYSSSVDFSQTWPPVKHAGHMTGLLGCLFQHWTNYSVAGVPWGGKCSRLKCLDKQAAYLDEQLLKPFVKILNTRGVQLCSVDITLPKLSRMTKWKAYF